MDWLWTLIERDCTGCGICADVSPHDAIEVHDTRPDHSETETPRRGVKGPEG